MFFNNANVLPRRGEMIFENLGAERARLLLGSGNEPAGRGERKKAPPPPREKVSNLIASIPPPSALSLPTLSLAYLLVGFLQWCPRTHPRY